MGGLVLRHFTGSSRPAGHAKPPPAGEAGRPPSEDNARAFEAARAAAPANAWVFSSHPVVERGRLGAWDDFKVDSPALIAQAATGLFHRGTRYRLWYRGCHLLGLEYSCSVGHAESSDLVRWTKAQGPVFSPSDAGEREHLGALTVAKGPSGYEMWFVVEPDWSQHRTHSAIHHATSADGASWQEDGSVLQAIDQDMSHHLAPHVLYTAGSYQMWYTDRLAPDGERMIVHAVSRDGRGWTVAGATPLSAFGDQDPGRLWVTVEPGGFRAWFAYNPKKQAAGRMLGVCTSADGSTWRDCQPLEDFAPKRPGGAPIAPAASEAGGAVWMLYAALPATGAAEITLAARKGAT
jgi:hypothetical protein